MRQSKLILFLTVLILIVSLPLTVEADDVLDKVVFFGDSTTAHMALRGKIPSARVWSGAGNTVLFETVNRTKCVHLQEENEDLTLAEAVKLKKPEILVITLGVSGGAGFLTREKFTEIYTEMLVSVKRASPDTMLFVQSILPLSHRSPKHFKKLNRESVIEANGWIEALCRELHIPYINTHDALIDETGYLPVLYQNDEYMHLTAAAYDVIRAQVRNAILSMQKGRENKIVP